MTSLQDQFQSIKAKTAELISPEVATRFGDYGFTKIARVINRREPCQTQISD